VGLEIARPCSDPSGDRGSFFGSTLIPGVFQPLPGLFYQINQGYQFWPALILKAFAKFLIIHVDSEI
jgi:hypothetical protein